MPHRTLVRKRASSHMGRRSGSYFEDAKNEGRGHRRIQLLTRLVQCIYAADFLADLQCLRTPSRRLRFSRRTPNRSKSPSLRLCSRAARRRAQLLVAHFSAIPSFVSFLATVPLPAPRGSDLDTSGVSVRCLYGYDWRGTDASGLSISACEYRVQRQPSNIWSSIQPYAVVVDDVDNDRDFACGRPRLEEDNCTVA